MYLSSINIPFAQRISASDQNNILRLIQLTQRPNKEIRGRELGTRFFLCALFESKQSIKSLQLGKGLYKLNIAEAF